ncbi:MAG: hypothetical protein A2445_04350 [Candidatus Jacksonbacteria bacterium RIFOXYC2_FULL_44_29]|nr:MAG: hypothetical protein UW45_C0044G0008 [Parcubacteria group bacterium GW2011_GWC2_44_22]OGY76255.1 MAG: hypothetical protein A2240_00935 [Candidatus Jacksonbacteria bacterium RIFOXYA2_FULL_43_12]OGY76674.1 MAG: hypothetical protein A2295_05060 [Candidatus Jacksonbacteria bacterium RIFOXYB2_FULL_44_15]OGY78048.1 MAG: hypothetical protein A2550_03395 [Candidatus Jacksonbacteria bacterium RIFOXYD2_FULL_43_21]OGY79460.1 MAG: hypothetical protein A2445_04350 [Candidatus Jacksonbacteria bacteri
MGIQIEFNPDLALRNISEYQKGRRQKSECIPVPLAKGRVYDFLKKGQRNYWFGGSPAKICKAKFRLGEVPLLETKGNQKLSRPKASIKIIEATHFIKNGEVWTRGKYKVVEVFNDDQVHFEGLARVSS